MTGMLAVLERWVAAAEALAASHVPHLAARLAAGSWPLLAGAAVVSLALLVAGARLGRVLAAAAAIAVGYATGTALAGAVGGLASAIPTSTYAWSAAIALGVAALIAPAVYPAALGALAGASLGAAVPLGGRPALGALAVAVVLAVCAVLLRRVLLATTAAAAGAALAAVVLLAVGRRYGWLALFGERPVLLAGVAALLLVAGAAFQLGAGVDRPPAARPRHSVG